MPVSDRYRDPSPVSLTQEAQKQLIKPLLSDRFPLPADWRCRYLLGSYPISEEVQKIRIIMELMEILWQDSPLVELLETFRRFERFMRALGKRDHFIHQFEVFLLGWFLMDFLLDKGYAFSSLTHFSPQDFIRLWLLTAMGHDVGFPLQESPQIFDSLHELYGHPSYGLNSTSKLLTKLVKRCSSHTLLGRPRVVKDLLSGLGAKVAEQTKLGIAYTTGLDQDMFNHTWCRMERLPKNHGFLSSLILGKEVLRVSIPEKDLKKAGNPSFKIHDLRLVLAAIALHPLKEEFPWLIEKIEFSRNPFAYLLYVTDNLQEWSRDLGNLTDEPNTLLCECESKYFGIILTFLVTHETWEDTILKKTKEEIENAQTRLRRLKGKRTGLTLTVYYTSTNKEIHEKSIILII